MLVRYPGQAMENGKILHASHDGIHVLRFVGDIRYTLGHSLDRFLEALFAGPTPEGFVIDLTATDCIDSTNLGLLVRVAREMHNHGAPQVTIVSDRPDINAVLASMALDEVFDIVSRASIPAGGELELPHDLFVVGEVSTRSNLVNKTPFSIGIQWRPEKSVGISLAAAQSGGSEDLALYAGIGISF